MSAISDLLKRLRRRGLTQSEIGRRTGIPQPRISRWENASPAGAADDALALMQLERELIAADAVITAAGDLDEGSNAQKEAV